MKPNSRYEANMKTPDLVNIQTAARLLKISARTLHQRINTGYYGTQKVGTILVDPATGRPKRLKRFRFGRGGGSRENMEITKVK